MRGKADHQGWSRFHHLAHLGPQLFKLSSRTSFILCNTFSILERHIHINSVLLIYPRYSLSIAGAAHGTVLRPTHHAKWPRVISRRQAETIIPSLNFEQSSEAKSSEKQDSCCDHHRSNPDIWCFSQRAYGMFLRGSEEPGLLYWYLSGRAYRLCQIIASFQANQIQRQLVEQWRWRANNNSQYHHTGAPSQVPPSHTSSWA